MRRTRSTVAGQGRRTPRKSAGEAARLPIGQMLVRSGSIRPKDLTRVIALQSRQDARMGDILLAQGLIDKPRLYRTIARQYETDVADFTSTPPDIRLVEMLGVKRCLALGLLPWQRRNDTVLVATARPEQFERHRQDLEWLFGQVRMVITSETDLHAAVLDRHPQALVAKAETRVAAAESCRDIGGARALRVLAPLAAGLVLAGWLAPVPTFLALTAWAMLMLIASVTLKIAALLAHWRARAAPRATQSTVIARLPTVSLLVPLYKEREIASRLVTRLNRLDYPRELLDILLIVEADDDVTCDTLDKIRLPEHMRQIVVPRSGLKTKPRALNYALDFCRGSIVGVYDAEDAPAPDQIRRIVQRFHERGSEVACLQGVLDFYNARTNWLSRCFTIEYAVWFRVLLPGLARLGLIVPLGGTTLFFRRPALEELGGWDAHNVTEDADLGVRLARHGYRTEMIDTITGEEANCRAWPWVKQRSRWLKGYTVTWAVHMRRPAKLWREVGPLRFLGFQFLFLGTITQFLLAPLLWSFWLLMLGLPHPVTGLDQPTLVRAATAFFLFSEAVGIALGLYAVRGPSHRFLMKWVPTLHFYFPLAALAAYKGVLELVLRPFYWDKTRHGVFDASGELAAVSTPAPEADAVIPPLRPSRHRA